MTSCEKLVIDHLQIGTLSLWTNIISIKVNEYRILICTVIKPFSKRYIFRTDFILLFALSCFYINRLHFILLLVRTIFFLGKIDLTLRSPVQCAPNNCLPTCHGCGRDTGRLFNYPTKWRLSTAGHSQCFYFSILST